MCCLTCLAVKPSDFGFGASESGQLQETKPYVRDDCTWRYLVRITGSMTADITLI